MSEIQPIQPGFGIRIKKLRFDRNMSQQDLADRCELSVDQIANIERGKNFTGEVSLGLIADAFGIAVQTLFDYSGNDEFVKNGGLKWRALRREDIPGIERGKITIALKAPKRRSNQ